MKKIMFLIPSMRGGGAERVMSILVKFLDRSKFQIILVTPEKPNYLPIKGIISTKKHNNPDKFLVETGVKIVSMFP